MSFFTDSSLCLIPSAVKDGKVYSIVPTSGDGDLTFSRGSDIEATRVAANGYIQKAAVNLLLQSQAFDNASWTKNNSSITANATTAPDGTLTADKLIENTVNNTHYTAQNVTLSNAVYTYSVYLKADTTTRARVQMSDLTTGDVRLDYDFSTETAAYNASGTRGSWGAIGYEITALTGGWVRFSLSGLKGAGSVISASVFLLDASGNNSYTGDGTSGLFVWGAQLNYGLVAQEYVETTTTSVVAGITNDMPRLDYSGGASCPSLLLEPERTNLVTQSEYFADSSWTKTAATTEVGFLSPEGNLNAYKLLEDNTTSIHRIYQASTVSASPNATISVYVKYNGRKFVLMRIADSGVGRWYDIENGVLGTTYLGTPNSSTIESMGNDWYRITISHSVASVARFELWVSDTESVSAYAGDITKGVYLYGAQVEVGSYPTSYIPTYGTSATRTADACYKTGISSLIGQTAGTLFLETNTEYYGSSNMNFALSNGTNDNNVKFIYEHATSKWKAEVNNNGSPMAIIETGVIARGTRVKLAVAYANNDFVFYVNGSLIGTDPVGSTAFPVTLSKISTDRGDGVAPLNGNLYQALVFKTRLSNSDLAALTTL